MKHVPSNNKTFWILVIFLSAIGIVAGILGFKEEYEASSLSGFYSTFQLFILHHSFEHDLHSTWLEMSRWCILIVFLLVSFQLFITIIAPRFIQYSKIRFFYKNHIVICGLNEICMELVDKFADAKMVVIAPENNKFVESLRQRKIKPIFGNPSDEYILKIAGIKNAAKLFAVTNSDKQNVEIAQTVSSLLKKEQRKEALMCFVSVIDQKLKTILEETDLFKFKTENIDALLFNINEIGIKYGICMGIDKILPETLKTKPEILLVGITEKTKNVIFNLAHCTTMQRDVFQFTIYEKDEAKIDAFQKKYNYLYDYVGVEISKDLEKLCAGKSFDSIFICTENQINSIKQAVEIHYLIGKNAPNIFLFCDDTNAFNITLQEEWVKKKIFPINLFGQLAGYVFELNSKIEEKAKKAHCFWNEIYEKNIDWDTLSGHFKQSNRNQILDHYLKIFIAQGKKFEDIKDNSLSFSTQEKETLAMMEHRRWVLEKLENGWTYGTRDNDFKRHDCLVPWSELSEEQQKKDYDTIDLMIKLLSVQ